MVTGLLLAVTWAVTLPAFQAPDEQSHFTYVQSIGERFALPGEEGRAFFSTELSQGITAVNSDQVAAQKEVRPEWSDRTEDTWAATQATAARDDGGGSGPASNYPPTAYAWEALGYLAASGGTVFDALLGARLMSALWVPITVLATWLLAGEVFGRRRVLQAAAAAVPALVPMFSFVSASVSPDGMMYALWTLALWTGVRCVRRGFPLREAAVFIALVGLACTVKATSYALVVPALVLIVLGIAARRPSGLRSVLRLSAAIAIPVALTLGVWVIAASSSDRPATVDPLADATRDTNWREFGSYLWQYYLPRPPFLTNYPTPPGGFPLLQVWITQGWAAFGWLEVKFEPWVYRVLGVLTMSIFGAGFVALVRARRRLDWRVVAFLAAACLALLAGLHWTDYHKLENGEPAFMQARYLFPVISIMGLALAGAVSLAPVRFRGALAGGAIAGLLVFHVLALGLTLERFYA